MRVSLVLLMLTLTVAWGAQPPAAPELSVSANGARDLDLYAGWPLIVRVSVMHSLRLARFGDQPPLRIAPPGMPWTGAIQFAAVSSSGKPASWPLSLVGTPPDPVLTLPNRSYVMVVWQMPADAVSALAPGTYRLAATLQVTGSDGWNGTVASAPVTIRIGPEPAALTPGQEAAKANLLAQYAVDSGDLATAASAIGGLLASQPDNVGAMATNARLLEQAGLTWPAFFQAVDALNAFFQNNPAPAEMPQDLLALYQDLLAEIQVIPSDTSGAQALRRTRSRGKSGLNTLPH
jgi:hypothetical protein